MYKIFNGNNLDLLDSLEDNSIDSIVTDGPYGLKFMNKKWDYDVPSVDFWKKVFRVLKPGGHILSFGGTRTYHRMVVNMEDAGFEIRDCISWIYGSGFPKSLNIGKSFDKRGGESIGWFAEWLSNWRKENNIGQSEIAKLFPSKTGGLTGCVSNWEMGKNLPTNEQFNLICETFNLPFKNLEEAEREFIGIKKSGIGKAFTKDGWGSGFDEVAITKGQSEYEGLGTALKPAQELICLARKPLSESSIVENVIKWGTGGLNIDGCRVGSDEVLINTKDTKGGLYSQIKGKRENNNYHIQEGRFPANIILECICDEVIEGKKGQSTKSGYREGGKSENSVGLNGVKYAPDNYNDKGDIHTNPECPCRVMDEQSGVSKSSCKSGIIYDKDANIFTDGYEKKTGHKNKIMVGDYSDKGGASRFFYVAKVSKKERNLGLDEFDEKEKKYNQFNSENRIIGDKIVKNPIVSKAKNNHPTCKPINLLTYLCRLITPKGGLILDPYMGSGSTGIASQLEGFNFIGFELDPEYFKIAEGRLSSWEEYKSILKNSQD